MPKDIVDYRGISRTQIVPPPVVASLQRKSQESIVELLRPIETDVIDDRPH
jgi:hypothetical protein